MSYRFDEDQDIFLVMRTPAQVKGTELNFSDVLMGAKVVGFSNSKHSMFVRHSSGHIIYLQHGSPSPQPKPFASAKEAIEWWNSEVDREKDIQSEIHNATMTVLERLRVGT